MIRRFLDEEPEDARRKPEWVEASREIIAEAEMTTLKRPGKYVWGPWLVSPTESTAQLSSDVGLLKCSFQKEEGLYVLRVVQIKRLTRYRK